MGEQQKQELKRTALLEQNRAKRVNKLQRIDARQARYDTKVDDWSKKLKTEGVKVKSIEATATEATHKLDERLEVVAEDHKNAMSALMTWQEIHGKDDADPEAVAAARLAMQEGHTKLSASIHEA